MQLDEKIKDFYKQVSFYTNAGVYKDYFSTLPDNISKLRDLVCDQHIHNMRVFRFYKKEEISENYVWLNCLYDALNYNPYIKF